MEATSSCETLVSSYPITRHHIPEDRISLHQEWSYRILLVDNLPTISPESGNSMKMGVKNAAFLNDSSGELFRKWNQTASWHILITNLMHWLLFIHKILFSSTCFEPLVLIFRRIQLYTCSIWYCHSLREFVVVCRCTAWVLCTYRPPRTLIESDSTICYMYTTVSSWRWALKARNM